MKEAITGNKAYMQKHSKNGSLFSMKGSKERTRKVGPLKKKVISEELQEKRRLHRKKRSKMQKESRRRNRGL